ncbi:MAG: DUF167 domain-containing protein [Victivallales bacterium]|nr:DUF167 domain-containing protein [Victivallales bacterium]
MGAAGKAGPPVSATELAAILQPTSRGVIIPCRIHPRAGREGIGGLHDGAVKIALKAPPVEGKANAALLKFLAERLHLPKAAVSLRVGATSRHKLVEAEGITPEAAAAALSTPSH